MPKKPAKKAAKGAVPETPLEVSPPAGKSGLRPLLHGHERKHFYSDENETRALVADHELDGKPAFCVKTKEEAEGIAAEFGLTLGEPVDHDVHKELVYPILKQE